MKPLIGLIPAHAGKTCRELFTLPYCEAHPRSRGENWGRRSFRGRLAGSSPLTRGKQPFLPCRHGSFGLIPAHAGKTWFWDCMKTMGGAHPRSRGENARTTHREHDGWGSSPLTRGKPQGLDGLLTVGGLIPAHAGKTMPPSTNSEPRRAHPRSRGENVFKSGADQMKEGSSPLTRGKRTSPTPPPTLSGLIPAHAGKTVCLGVDLATDRAHPRSRGENLIETDPTQAERGSSPLTRGKRHASVQAFR